MRTIYHHGEIITMECQDTIYEAVIVNADKIMNVGTNEEILAQAIEEDAFVDLQGAVMFPGFIDGHSHFTGVATSLSQCDLSTASSFQDIVEKMKHFIEENHIQEGDWVVGRAYDHNFLNEKKHPTRLILDQISSVHPIVIVHQSSHMGVANSLALEIAGVKDALADPAGGTYGRMEQSQELDGYMEETAFFSFQKQIPLSDIDAFLKQMVEAQQMYARYGITTMQEGMVNRELFQILEEAVKHQTLFLDLVAYIDLQHDRSLVQRHKEYTQRYHHHLRIGGYKIFLDGSPQGRTAWMKEPYEEGKEGYCGYPAMKDEQLLELINAAIQDQVQLLAHCNGDAAAEQYIRQCEIAVARHPQEMLLRPVMIHAQFVQKDQLRRMLPLHMIPSFFIAHTYYWGDVHIKNLGWKRASRISPANDAEQYRLPYTFHQDSPVVPCNMMHTVWCAVNRKTKNGTILGAQEAITPCEAMKAITINGAYQYFEEDVKGTITPGKQADLVILDENPMKVEADKIKDIQVLATIKDGKLVYQAE